ARRQTHQPIALDARLRAIGAEMRLAETPAVEDDLVAGLPARMGRGFDSAGEINARDHRETPHHRRLAGDREPVLIIHRRPFHRDGDVAVHQILVVEIGEPHRLAALGLVDDDSLECRHVPSALEHFSGKVVAGFPKKMRPNIKPGHLPIQRNREALYAGTAATRGTGFSTIGMLISADRTPNMMASHHTGPYEP